MKTSTVLIIAGAGVAILFILSRSSSGIPLLGKAPPTSSTSTILAAAGAGAAAGGILSKLFGSSGSGSSVASSGGSSYIPDTATSNYLADATAASDDATGVVGFGGWDD